MKLNLSLFGPALSLQPDRVQSERLPHLRGPDQSSESGSVLHLQRGLCDRLERSGRGGNRALPNPATVTPAQKHSNSADCSRCFSRGFSQHFSSSTSSLPRSSALGFFTGVGRVAAIMGNVVFGKLVDSSCTVPILLVSALLLAGGLVALLLPQTRQTELTWSLTLVFRNSKFLKFSRPKRIWCVCCLQTIICAF